jgi:UDP-N-acetylmuramoylalanine--D-glutamate ligase
MKNLKGKNFYVIGAGLSGIAAYKKLKNYAKEIYLYDDKIQEGDFEFKHYKDADWKNLDFLVLSPSIRNIHKDVHPAVKLAVKYGVRVTNDIELFANYFISKAKIIAITGTNGKSTTSSLLYHILKDNKINAIFGGNIGIPVFDLQISDKEDTYYVLEISSYQLDSINDKIFDFAAIINISPDHLDRYANKMENYILSKERIFSLSKKSADNLIVIDDRPCQKIYSRNKNLISLSGKSNKADYYTENNFICFEEEKISLSKVEIIKIGSLENLLVSFVIAKKLELKNDNILKSVNNFHALEHRLEFVREINNIKFYNDSKATNIESTINALAKFKRILWIAGGVAKAGGIKKLDQELGSIEGIFLIGESQDLFSEQLEEKKYIDFEKFEDLKSALDSAYKKGLKIDDEVTILFSPAAASFDNWNNFMERGQNFKDLVKEL